MLDAFDSVNPEDYIKGFPWHPHRGIETVTYLIRGKVEHGDSLGNRGIIKDGDCQWMTAGSGIIHQEMPKDTDRMLGVQLWVNLPSKDKMTKPKYKDIVSEIIPNIKEDNGVVKIISGAYKGIQGAIVADYVKPLFLDVEVEGGAKWQIKTQKKETLFIYIVQGEGYFGYDDDIKVIEKNAILFEEGDLFAIKAGEKGVRFLLLLGQPLNEPIAWGGPIVMNTKEELKLAFEELDAGTFIKK